MLKRYSRKPSWHRILRKLFQLNKKDLIDIIVFGSSVRGKEIPGDLDVLVLFKEKADFRLVSKISRKIETYGIKAEVLGKSYDEIFSSSFLAREDILSDSYSIRLRKKLSEGFGYTGLVMFRYFLSGMGDSDRVKFHYAIAGRKKERGIIEKLSGIKLTTSVVLVSTEKSEKFAEFLNFWKVDYKKTKILIPEKTLKFMRFNSVN